MALIGLLLSRREMFRKHKSLALVLTALAFIMFLMIGAALFMLVEGFEYEKMQRHILDAKDRILKKHTNMSEEAMDDFLNEMRDAGIRGLPRKDGTVVKLTFSNSFFFVVTLLTTVGYGHITPMTVLGKITCIIYTTVGIPITLIYMARYVDCLLKASENYKAFLFLKFHMKFKPFFIRFMHVSSLMAVIVLTCFIGPALIFSHYEKGWGILDGIYFCFISLTTVGLGDMVPALDSDMIYADVYKYAASLYLIVGITFIMFMMAMCGDFCKNYMNDYEMLPVTVSTEKVLISPGGVVTYGSIIIQSGRSETDEKQ